MLNYFFMALPIGMNKFVPDFDSAWLDTINIIMMKKPFFINKKYKTSKRTTIIIITHDLFSNKTLMTEIWQISDWESLLLIYLMLS